MRRLLFIRVSQRLYTVVVCWEFPRKGFSSRAINNRINQQLLKPVFLYHWEYLAYTIPTILCFCFMRRYKKIQSSKHVFNLISAFIFKRVIIFTVNKEYLLTQILLLLYMLYFSLSMIFLESIQIR